MPIVDIHLIAGRSQDQLKGLVEDVTAAVVKNTGAPAEHVHVILSEMEKNRYSVGGVLKSDEKQSDLKRFADQLLRVFFSVVGFYF